MREYEVTHETHYKYSMPVAFSRHVAYLCPATSPRQTLMSHSHTVAPVTSEESKRLDYFGNTQLHFQIETRHTELSVVARSVVRVHPQNTAADPAATITCGELRQLLRTDTTKASLHAVQMCSPSEETGSGGAVKDFAAHLFPDDRPFLEAALDLNRTIFTEFKFDNEATEISTPVDEVLRLRRGVCQDFAHLMLASLRSMRLPGRYVSGYILTHPPAGKPRLQGTDASHAWVSIYVPGAGWIDLDPTNNLVCDNEHVVVAIGRDFDDVSPVRGAVTGGGSQAIRIAVTMNPVEEMAL